MVTVAALSLVGGDEPEQIDFAIEQFCEIN
jgi:hypothetical protein